MHVRQKCQSQYLAYTTEIANIPAKFLGIVKPICLLYAFFLQSLFTFPIIINFINTVITRAYLPRQNK